MKYVTIKQIIDEKLYPFTFGQLRSLLLHRYENGLNKCIRKIGKCLYIRVDLFEEWIESHEDINESL